MDITIVNTPDYVHSKSPTDPKGGGVFGFGPKDQRNIVKKLMYNVCDEHNFYMLNFIFIQWYKGQIWTPHFE